MRAKMVATQSLDKYDRISYLMAVMWALFVLIEEGKKWEEKRTCLFLKTRKKW